MSEVKPTDRWQTKITSLKEGIRHIYDTKEFSNAVFIVRGKKFDVHKEVLSARCSEFAQKLLVPNAVSEHIVENDSITIRGFELLIRFIYKDTLGTEDKTAIVEAYIAADHYKQTALKNLCDRKIESWSITFDEVCSLLNASLKIPTLRQKCVDFIKDNAQHVITSAEFFKLNLNSLIIIMESDALDNVPLKERIQRIIEWGANRHTLPVNYALVREDFLTNTPPLLGMLRLDLLSLKDFSKIASTYKKLVTDEEGMAFLEFYNTNDRSVLPDWCR